MNKRGKGFLAMLLAFVIIFTTMAPVQALAVESTPLTVQIQLFMGSGRITVSSNNVPEQSPTITVDNTDEALGSFYARITGEYYLSKITAPAKKSFDKWEFNNADGNVKTVTKEEFIKQAKLKAKEGDALILTACWKTVWSVTYDADGGVFTDTNDFKVLSIDDGTSFGDALKKLNEQPTREGYTWKAWYTKGTNNTKIPAKDTDTITTNTTFYAAWEGNKYKLDLYSDGKKLTSTPKEVTFGDYYGDVLITPSKAGYTFTGWYNEKNQKVDELSYVDIAKDHRLDARWKTITYKISYDLQGGKLKETPKYSYTVESPTFTVEDPTKEGCVFLGWSVSKDGKVQPSEENSKGFAFMTGSRTGDYKLTAKWGVDPNSAQALDALKKSEHKGVYYNVTSGDAVITGVKNKKITSVVIPATITVNAKVYKVTTIQPNAFKGCTSLKKVTIGKNVTTIGKSAFSGCKRLGTITIKSNKLNMVGSKAIKGIKKSASIKVPGSKREAYKKLFTKSTGFSDTMKIK